MIDNIKRLIGLVVWLVCTACASQPEQVTKVSEPAPIYPDYADVTIPYNIAPLNFLLRNDASALQVTVSGQKESLTVNGDRKMAAISGIYLAGCSRKDRRLPELSPDRTGVRGVEHHPATRTQHRKF